MYLNKCWHGSVGVVFTGKDGTYCGRVGLAYPCDSQEDGWAKGIEWMKNDGEYRRREKERGRDFLVRTYELEVRYF